MANERAEALRWQEPRSNYVGGDEVTPGIFNCLGENEKYLKDEQDIIKQVKITTDQVQDAVVNITQAEERVNLATTEKVKTTFGKIKKWFSDLRALAFKDKVSDSDIIDINASKVIGLHSVATSGNYTELNNKPTITKEAVGLAKVANERQYSAEYPPTNFDVGLGNVSNEKQYSEQNAPPYPVTSVSGKVGDVELGKSDVGLDNLDNIRQYSSNNIPPYPVSSVSGKIGDVIIKKEDVGLSAVENERQYSANNPPSYPVTSVNGKTGEVNLNKADVGLSNVSNERQYSATNPPPREPGSVVIYDIKNLGISNFGYPNGIPGDGTHIYFGNNFNEYFNRQGMVRAYVRATDWSYIITSSTIFDRFGYCQGAKISGFDGLENPYKNQPSAVNTPAGHYTYVYSKNFGHEGELQAVFYLGELRGNDFTLSKTAYTYVEKIEVLI